MPTPNEILAPEYINVPRYQQVFSALKQWIVEGHYPRSGAIEPESKLCEMFGVSRITVRKALEMLSREGLVKSIQGKGTFVSADMPGPALHGEMRQRIARAREMANSSKAEQFNASVTKGSAEIWEDLKLPADTEVMKVSYVRVLQQLNIGYVESYYPLSLNINITENDFETSTLLTILPDKGITLSGIEHLVGATLADARLAQLLKINVGAPLVRVKMTMLNTAHEPVQKVIAYFRADEYEHHLFLGQTGQELN
jgi:GntR family transcriptional regulator|tara:strand:+ start:3246 stop:4010 length:765 start_codon:yes stop_codon:yes gene_type:complete